MYIWQQPDWPTWEIDMHTLAAPLASARHAQGRLLGRMEGLGFKLRNEACLETLTKDVIKTSEIEGEHLDNDQVRSSIARRLGMDIGALAPVDRNVEGIVDVMLDATQRYGSPLTRERLFAWHGALFPTGRSGLHAISVAAWRTDNNGPMQVISGLYGKEKVHYEAPPAAHVGSEMNRFFKWFAQEYKANKEKLDPVIKAGLAHLWFVTIHPFDDGNGRLARVIGDMALARSEQTQQRFYSLSAQILCERASYYDLLEQTQRGSMDVTGWLAWFLGCLERSTSGAQNTLESVLAKARFWETFPGAGFNERQTKLLNRLLDGFEGKLTTSKWAKIAKCSQDTAYRDIVGLIEMGALVKADAGGRSTSYQLAVRSDS